MQTANFHVYNCCKCAILNNELHAFNTYFQYDLKKKLTNVFLFCFELTKCCITSYLFCFVCCFILFFVLT